MATTYTQRQYTESDAVKKLREQMEAQTAAKPAEYTSKWQPQLDAAAQNILDRKEFSYDVNGDAMWNQYKDRYINLGRQAMQDTMGQAAALTGGYGNSYAQMAGQQAYQGYLQGLTDKIPELAQLALDRYNQQGQQLYDQYNLLNTQEQNAHNQWLQNYNLWNDERNFLTGRYDTERGYDYGVHRDTVSDDQWKAQFDEDIRRFDFANKLGEFAPAARAVSSGGGSNAYYGPASDPDEVDMSNWGAGEWEAYISAVADEYGKSAAGKEISAQVNSGNMPKQYSNMVQLALSSSSGTKPAQKETDEPKKKIAGSTTISTKNYKY
jgi:hypothetical protein